MRIGDDRQDGAAADRWAAPQGVDGASPPRRVGSFSVTASVQVRVPPAQIPWPPAGRSQAVS